MEVSREILYNVDLSDGEKLLWHMIKEWSENYPGEPLPSETLAKIAGKKSVTVKKLVARLRDLGLILSKGEQPNKPKILTIPDQLPFAEVDDDGYVYCCWTADNMPQADKPKPDKEDPEGQLSLFLEYTEEKQARQDVKESVEEVVDYYLEAYNKRKKGGRDKKRVDPNERVYVAIALQRWEPPATVQECCYAIDGLFLTRWYVENKKLGLRHVFNCARGARAQSQFETFRERGETKELERLAVKRSNTTDKQRSSQPVDTSIMQQSAAGRRAMRGGKSG